MITKARKAAKDPLYRKSLYIMASSVTASFYSYVFWILAAKMCPKADDNIATGLISAADFLATLTRFGHDNINRAMIHPWVQGLICSF